MRLRTFTASDMQTAMAQVRAAMGDDAVIIATATDKAKGKVTITAAVEEASSPLPVARRQSPASAGNGERATENASLLKGEGNTEWLDDLTLLLRYHSTPEALAGRLVYKARHLEIEKLFALQKISGGESSDLLEIKALARLLATSFRFSPLPLTQPGLRLMLVGPPGIGKTLSVAKLAAQLVMDKAKVTVITTDNKRAGGIEQLAAFTEILELPLKVAQDRSQLARMLKNLATDERVLVDTAGCNPYDKADLDELTEYIGVGGFEPVLTLPAGIDSFEAADAVRAFAYPAITRLLVTRADTARRFGSVLAAADARGLAVSCISNSARVVDEIQPLDATALARLMLQYRL